MFSFYLFTFSTLEEYRTEETDDQEWWKTEWTNESDHDQKGAR